MIEIPIKSEKEVQTKDVEKEVEPIPIGAYPVSTFMKEYASRDLINGRFSVKMKGTGMVVSVPAHRLSSYSGKGDVIVTAFSQ
jgi:hypothetical protein